MPIRRSIRRMCLLPTQAQSKQVFAEQTNPTNRHLLFVFVSSSRIVSALVAALRAGRPMPRSIALRALAQVRSLCRSFRCHTAHVHIGLALSRQNWRRVISPSYQRVSTSNRSRYIASSRRSSSFFRLGANMSNTQATSHPALVQAPSGSGVTFTVRLRFCLSI